MHSTKNDVLKRFLEARSLIDSQPIKKDEPKKDKPMVVQKETVDNASYRHIINTKPSKKVVIDFLRDKVASLLDDSSDDDL